MPASWSWASTTARGRTGGHGTQPRPGTRAACLARAPRSPAPSVNGRRASGCVRVAARPRPPRLVEPSEHVHAFTSFSYKCDFEAWPHGEDTLSPGLHHSIQLHVLVHVCVPVCLCVHMHALPATRVVCVCARPWEPACSMGSGSQSGPRIQSVDVPTARTRSPDRDRRPHGQTALVCPSAGPAPHAALLTPHAGRTRTHRAVAQADRFKK